MKWTLKRALTISTATGSDRYAFAPLTVFDIADHGTARQRHRTRCHQKKIYSVLPALDAPIASIYHGTLPSYPHEE